MPTVTIDGVKHTIGSNTYKRMRAQGKLGSSASAKRAVSASSGIGAGGVPQKSVKRAASRTPAQAAPVPRARADRPGNGQTSGSGSRSVAAGARQRNIADATRMATSGSNRSAQQVTDTNRMRNSGSGKQPPIPGLKLPKAVNAGPGGTPTKGYDWPKANAGPGGTPTKGYVNKGKSIAATGVTVPSPENAMTRSQRETRKMLYDRANKKRGS